MLQLKTKILFFINLSQGCPPLVTYLTKEFFVSLYCSLVRPHFEYTIQVNYSYPKKYIHHLEKKPKRSNKVDEMS